jgi:phospholipid/cholesterol/gamma-HCH transport system substrate-binding protein
VTATIRGRRGVARRKTGPDRRAAVRFGLFAVVTIALTIYMGLRILGTDFGDTQTFTAGFDDVNGLKSGDLVKIAGAPVGHVDSVKVRLGKAVVKVSVRKDIDLPDDSQAVIRWRNLIGVREVYLEPGQSSRFLSSGGHITRTQSTVDLGTVINSLGPLTGSLDPNQINKILQAFATALNGNQGNINEITTNLGKLLSTFSARAGTIDQMVKDYKTVTDAVAARDSEIAQTVQNLATLTQAFGSSTAVLDNALRQLSTFSGNLDAVVGARQQQLGTIVDNTRNLMEIAHKRAKTIDAIIKGLPTALQALLTTVDGGHFTRTALVCLNVTLTTQCPFKDSLPPPAASGTAKQSPAQQAQFNKLATLFLLGAAGGS